MDKEKIVMCKSGDEKELLDMIRTFSAKLPYELKQMEDKDGSITYYYDIPMEDKRKVFKEMYPFEQAPDLEDTLLDIHENKCFTVKDFLVIRENGRNYLVSPYYVNSGGTVIDWVVPGENGDWTGISANEFRQKLDYEKEPLEGVPFEVNQYIIPKDEKNEVILHKLNLDLDEENPVYLFFDYHANKCFKVSDSYLVNFDYDDIPLSPFFREYCKLEFCAFPILEKCDMDETLSVNICDFAKKILPYKGSLKLDSDGEEYFEYDIPDEERERIFCNLYPLRPLPDMDLEIVVIGKELSAPFKIRDFRVLRKDGSNFLAAPDVDSHLLCYITKDNYQAQLLNALDEETKKMELLKKHSL